MVPDTEDHKQTKRKNSVSRKKLHQRLSRWEICKNVKYITPYGDLTSLTYRTDGKALSLVPRSNILSSIVISIQPETL